MPVTPLTLAASLFTRADVGRGRHELRFGEWVLIATTDAALLDREYEKAVAMVAEVVAAGMEQAATAAADVSVDVVEMSDDCNLRFEGSTTAEIIEKRNRLVAAIAAGCRRTDGKI